MLALGSPAALRDPGQGGPGSSPEPGLSPQLRGKTMAMEARSRRGPDGDRGDTADTRAALTCEPGGTHGPGPPRHPLRPETLAKFEPSLTHPPPAQGSSNQSGRRGGEKKKKKRLKSTMKRHNKHQLYPKKRSSKFSADERLPRSSAAPPDPHHKLGGGGRGRDFPSVLPFCASPPLRSAPLLAKSRRGCRRQRAARGCSCGAAPRRRAGSEGGPGRACGAAGLPLPTRRRDTARTRTPTLCME